MTFALMLFDYIDRQVIVSLFPHLKAEWNLSDKELGALVSIISIVVVLGGVISAKWGWRAAFGVVGINMLQGTFGSSHEKPSSRHAKYSRKWRQIR